MKPATQKTKTTQKDDLFNVLRNLWTKTNLVTTHNTNFKNVYQINRFVSLTKQGFLAAQDLNMFKNLPPWASLVFLYYSLPKMAAPYKKYPKNTQEKLTSAQQAAVQRICLKFCVKPFHALQIIDLFEMQGIHVVIK